ncbi:MAG: six-cysteine ranthipeptide SCIFF [Dialister sp.]|nr:six-cysteine ranthipeptide SCIFF [Dialister sp.]
MSKHIVTINEKSLQDSLKFEGCSECQTSCQSACKTSCTIGNLICTTEEEEREAKRA